ncbi:MAG: Eco57I restriction-modification methylase domain-containing protein [Candidatus Lokiarchaeota archaeon]|nr:Eco57I restriction-modification methylase domain-containing protein [Candidatus Lokiarchaeota archaeon]
MNDLDNILDLPVLFKKIQLNLEKNNIEEIKKKITFLHSSEKDFLERYRKRKKEGVYYTNQEIADYMVSLALISYIQKIETSVELEKIEDIYGLDNQTKNRIFCLLKKTTFCDPACGSGVFLLSVMRLLFNILKNLCPNSKNAIISNAIVNNLYGFDINENAIKLCVLKLFEWASIISKKFDKEVFSALKSRMKVADSLFTKIMHKFDIIIGNPPYGNIIEASKKDLLKKQNLFYKDIYCAFLIKALDWCEYSTCFLVPKSFLIRQDYVKFRNNLLQKANIRTIVDIGPNNFKRATNEVQVVLYEKKADQDAELDIIDYPKKKIIQYPSQNFDSLRICKNDECPMCVKVKKIRAYVINTKCPFCKSQAMSLNRIRIKATSTQLKIIDEIEKKSDLNYLNVRNFPRMIRGEEHDGLKEVKKNLKNDLSGNCLFLNAKQDFSPYRIEARKSFSLNTIDPSMLKGSNYEFYKGPRLLIKHNTIVPEAVFTFENACFTSSIYSLLHEDLDELKYLCAVLNSKLIKFYCTYGINNQKGTTINLNQYMIRHLPIIKPSAQLKIKISEKVENITKTLQNRGRLGDSPVKKWINEIDLFLCDLYGLEFVDLEL